MNDSGDEEEDGRSALYTSEQADDNDAGVSSIRYLFSPPASRPLRSSSSEEDSDDEEELEELLGERQESGYSMFQLLSTSMHRSRAIMARPNQDPLRDVISVSSPQMFRALMTMIYNYDEEDLDFSVFSDYSDIPDTPVHDTMLQRLERFSMVDSEATTCSICRDHILSGQRCVRLPCAHVYHESCICQWFSTKNTCPLCRTAITNDEERGARTRQIIEAQEEEEEEEIDVVEPIPNMLEVYRRRRDQPTQGRYQLIMEMGDSSDDEDEEVEVVVEVVVEVDEDEGAGGGSRS